MADNRDIEGKVAGVRIWHALALGGFGAGLAATALASPAVGDWQAPVDRAVIEVYDCGPSTICGRVLDSAKLQAQPDQRDIHNPDPALRDRPVRGEQMMQSFVGGPVRWTGGRLYNPDTGASYPADITVEGGVLRLNGCLVRPLCLTQTWKRIR